MVSTPATCCACHTTMATLPPVTLQPCSCPSHCHHIATTAALPSVAVQLCHCSSCHHHTSVVLQCIAVHVAVGLPPWPSCNRVAAHCAATCVAVELLPQLHVVLLPALPSCHHWTAACCAATVVHIAAVLPLGSCMSCSGVLLPALPSCHHWAAACRATTVVCVAIALPLWPCSHLLRCSHVAACRVVVRWLYVVPWCTTTHCAIALLLLLMLCIAATVVAGATGITILWLPLGCACTHNLMSENKEQKKSTTYH